MLTPGTYRAVAIDAALGETSTGKEQVAVQFRLLDVEHAPLTWYGYWTEATADRTIESLRIAGWTGTDLMDLTELASGQTPEVSLVIDEEADLQGVMRTRIRWINRPNGQGVAIKNPLEPDKAKAFAARMKGQIVAFDKGKPPVKRPPAAPASGQSASFNDAVARESARVASSGEFDF